MAGDARLAWPIRDTTAGFSPRRYPSRPSHSVQKALAGGGFGRCVPHAAMVGQGLACGQSGIIRRTAGLSLSSGLHLSACLGARRLWLDVHGPGAPRNLGQHGVGATESWGAAVCRASASAIASFVTRLDSHTHGGVHKKWSGVGTSAKGRSGRGMRRLRERSRGHPTRGLA